MNDPEDSILKIALISSLEKRWGKTDQGPFIAAVILNPFLRNSPLTKKAGVFMVTTISNLVKELWRRFYGTPAPPELQTQLREYVLSSGSFSDIEDAITSLRGEADSANTSPNPLRFYTDRSTPGAAQPALFKLAIHLLSICPNSASCERLFSTFGLILTKLRARLGVNKMLDLATLKLHLRDEHLRNRSKNKQRQRAFGVWKEKPTSTQQRTGSGASLAQDPEDGSSLTQPQAPNNPIQGPNVTTSTLQAITANLEAMLELDQDAPGSFQSTSIQRISLADLFDSGTKGWIKSHLSSAIGSLNDEFQVYELLDLDAPGEQDLEQDLDEAVENILTT